MLPFVSSRGLLLDELAQEGVGRALATDGRLLAVTGEHHDVVGERQHLLGEAAQHRGVVAAGEVGTADRALEQQVAGEHELADVRRVVSARKSTSLNFRQYCASC